MLECERVQHPLDRTPKRNKFVMYYDASLDTIALWFAHPDLVVGFYMKTSIHFRGFHISALELLTMVWGMGYIGRWTRSNGYTGPILLIPYGDNSSVPLVIHKTFARSFGMEFVMDLKRKYSRNFDIDV